MAPDLAILCPKVFGLGALKVVGAVLGFDIVPNAILRIWTDAALER